MVIRVFLGLLVFSHVIALPCEIKRASADEEIVRFNELWEQERVGNTCLLCKRPEGVEGEGEPLEGDVIYFKIVSLDEKRAIGYLSCTLHGPERMVWVDNFFVEKPYRNRGIGKQALIQMEAVLKEKDGFDAIALTTTSEQKGAFALYSKLGYQVLSKREQAGVEIYLMKKPL